jgi:glycosyltransferase involved in cell wall biosynthesis
VAPIEALAAGCPVIVTSSGPIEELVTGGSGPLVPRADAAALPDATAGPAAPPPCTRGSKG